MRYPVKYEVLRTHDYGQGGILDPIGSVLVDGCDHAAARAANEAIKVFPQLTGTFGVRKAEPSVASHRYGGVSLFRVVPPVQPRVERVSL